MNPVPSLRQRWPHQEKRLVSLANIKRMIEQPAYLIMRDWNCAMEYEPEFCMATCVAMENFHPLQEKHHIIALANTGRFSRGGDI